MGPGRGIGRRPLPEHSRNGYRSSRDAPGQAPIDVAARAGIDHRVHTMRRPSATAGSATRGRRYGPDAAAALGSTRSACSRHWSRRSTSPWSLAVVPVDRELDLKRLADARGGRRAALADPAAAERATGYVVGGISPLGGRRPLPVVVDRSTLAHASIYISAGQRGLQLDLAPADSSVTQPRRSRSIARDRPTL